VTAVGTLRGAAELWDELASRVAAGQRFAGLSAASSGDPLVLTAYIATPDGIDVLDAALPPGAASYPGLTPRLGAAFWYERVIHDQAGVVPDGHPRLAPLIRPGDPQDHALPRHVAGYGLFTIPHGPVRSGVFESMEYLVETPGEAIPHLNMRIFYKHRGVAARFTGMTVADGVLLAERAEGIASVAHALAYCHAVEAIAGCQPPPAAGLVRMVHAELERIANHLDVAMRLADAAGLAVATARFALHKERVLRLVSRMCGSRFGRSVVIPGGVTALPSLPPAMILGDLAKLEKQVTGDAAALMATSSFLDRLRGTGPLTPARAREHGALGPIGKASGCADDTRLNRPYDAYQWLGVEPARPHSAGDALAWLRVRWEEAGQAFRLIRQAIGELDERPGEPLQAPWSVRSRGGPMSIWVLRGLRDGVVTTRWPRRPDEYADSWRGPVTLVDGTRELPGIAGLCPTGAITDSGVDQGKCILCGRCVAQRPDVFAWSAGPGAAAVTRQQLLLPEETDEAVEAARAELARRTAALRRSVHVRHVDAGSDGSEEWEIQALLGPIYDVHRLGVFFTASPRHADVLLVTGAGSAGMAGSLRTTYEGMPDPKVVIAAGTDAVSGGLLAGSPAVAGGLAAMVPVDVFVAGSPPPPFVILSALLIATGKLANGEKRPR
jgi:formate hydrogenlyase subunit 5